MYYYSKNIKDELTNINEDIFFEEWYMIVERILLNKEFQKRKFFRHHDETVWQHSIEVSYNSFITAKYYHYDEKCAAISGLLHDFYPKAYKFSNELYLLDPSYLSEIKTRKPLLKMHGFTHAKQAADNAKQYFPDLVNDKIYSCIKTHMFPLNRKLPEYIEGWLITYHDKRSSMKAIKEIKYIPKIIKTKLSRD